MQRINEADALRYGQYVHTEHWTTCNGTYTIRIIRYEGRIWLHKMQNGTVVQFIPLD